MTLGEVIQITLQKGFFNEEKFEDDILDIIADEEYSVNCQNIIPALNEVLQKLDKYQENIARIVINKDWINEHNEGSYWINMKEKFPNFKTLKFKGIYLNSNQFNDYEIRFNYLILPELNKDSDQYIIFYREKPQVFNVNEIEEALEEKIKIKDEYSVLIPLYVVSEILKDENLTLSTMYRNQFEAGLDDIELSDEYTPEIKNVLGIRW